MTTLWPDVSVPVVFMGEINLPDALPSNVLVASVQLSQRAKVCLHLLILIPTYTYTYYSSFIGLLGTQQAFLEDWTLLMPL